MTVTVIVGFLNHVHVDEISRLLLSSSVCAVGVSSAVLSLFSRLPSLVVVVLVVAAAVVASAVAAAAAVVAATAGVWEKSH